MVPQAPTLVREPFHRDSWVYEEKSTARASSPRPPGQPQRTRHTRRFRDVAAAIAKLSARSPRARGEVAIHDQQLRSRFDWMREPDPDAVATPPLFMAFVLPYRDGRDLGARPLRDPAAPGWRTSSRAAS